MNCREGCGACCIAPSISTPMPGMPDGKPAGVPCLHLTSQLRCALFDDPRRPAVCGSLQPQREMCSDSRKQALVYLGKLERLTQPASDC